MDADELIARLAAEGEFDSVGSFTLDPVAALEKLREFQLRDPTRFVLSWVRAAVLLGATRIDIEIDADDVWLSFDGELLDMADFESLWAAAIGRHGSARVRACRELALGINGAFTWEAKSVDVRSGELQVDFDRQFAMTPSKVAASSHANIVHAKRPIGWDIVRRRMLDARGELPEELILAQACAYASVPIYLEGKQLNVPKEPADTWQYVAIDDGEWRGGLWLTGSSRHSNLRVLVSGVEVASIQLPFGAGKITAVIDDPLLPLDLSQEKPVEGERWQAMLDCVSRARWAAWFQLAARKGWPSSRGPELEHMIADIFASPDTSWTELPGGMEFADRLVVPRAVSDPEGDLRRGSDPPNGQALMPWPSKPAPALSLGEVIRSARRLGVSFTSPTVRSDLAYVPELPVLLHDSFVGLRNHGQIVLDRPPSDARYRAALADLRTLSGGKPLPDEWLEHKFDHRADQQDLRLRVAWKRGATSGHGALVIGRDGKCLARHGLPPSWGPLWIEIEAPFPLEPGPAYDELLATAMLAALGRYHDLLAGLDGERLSEYERQIVIGYLGAAFDHWSAFRSAELLILPAPARRRAIEAWRGPWGVPDAWADPTARDRDICDHPLMDLAWFERGKRRFSLRDIQREIALSSGRLCWITALDRQSAPAEVWRLTPPERAILASVFPGMLERFDERAWQRREIGPYTVPERLSEARASVTLLGDAGEHGVLALAPRRSPGSPESWARLPSRGARLRLLGNGHDLGWLDVPLPIGSLYGVIEVPNARAVAHGDVALKNEAWRAAAAVVEAGALALAQAQLDEWIAGRHEADDHTRVSTWMIDLERGAWPSVAAALANWQATLEPEHPLRVHPTA